MPAPSQSPLPRRLVGAPWSEGALAVVTAVAQLAPLLFVHSDSGRPWHWWGYLAAVGASLPLAVRRRAPAPVLLVCATFSSLYDLAAPLAPQPLWYGVLIALHGMASVSPPRVRIPVLLAICAAGLASIGSLDTATRGVVLCGAAAYRIVQEALNNVVKHAGAARVEVRLCWRDDGLDIRVVDDGRGAGKDLPSGGNGLTGLRERAAACGGTATAGPREDRLPGFEVRARLPLAAPGVGVVA
ncbi:ATP-binding protein [Streptomyces sp. NPDC002055]|uniref:ATP-binding protein n=1 Tax=Streptomyces sp. NPDC002055 TaxID=3154534 RepID=UPI00332BC681